MGDGSASDGGPAQATGRAGGRLAPVLELVDQQLPPELQQRCDGFLGRYFKHLSSLDLKARQPRDLLGAALAHLRLGEVRTDGTANVHVFNPDLAANGWQSAHTVVQIVTDDMPFLVDSVRMAMTAMGLGIHLVIHPMLRVVRDEGKYVRVEDGTANEAWIYVEVDRCDATRLERLREHLVAALDDVRVAVIDWRPMRDRCDQLAHELEHSVLPLGTGESTRAAQFLRWLSDDHLVFLGYREYDFVREAADDDVVVAVPGTGLGLLRDGRRTEEPHRLSSVTPEARRMVFAPAVLMLTTANSRSTVCRADYLAYVGVKRFDREGRVVGERRFLGLYNSDVYRDSVLDIPLLRDKAAEVLDRAGFGAESHSGRALRQILETYPRNDLFQIDADELYEIATGILELQDRRQVRLFERRDDYGRFVSCLVYLPRDRYSTDRAEQIASALQEAYGGTGTEHEVLIGMGALARLHVRVALGRGGPSPGDPRRREAPERHRRGLVGRARRRAGRRAGRGRRPRRAGPLRQRVPGRLPRRLPAVGRRGGRRAPAGDRARGRPHHRAAPAPRRGARGGALHADAPGRTTGAVRGAPAARGSGRDGGRRADPRDPRRGPQRLALRHRAAGLGPRPDRRPRHPGRVLRHLRRAVPG